MTLRLVVDNTKPPKDFWLAWRQRAREQLLDRITEEPMDAEHILPIVTEIAYALSVLYLHGSKNIREPEPDIECMVFEEYQNLLRQRLVEERLERSEEYRCVMVRRIRYNP